MKYYLKALENYTNFKGRARRSEYWYFFLFNTIISIVLSVIDQAIDSKMIGIIYSIALLLPSVAVGVRRMHDVNKSGWFIIVPFYNLYLACLAGTTGENQYGADPKADVKINTASEK